jgi:hypothetical protein
MKKIWICTAILLIALTGVVSAQTGAGAMWIGGTAGFSSSGGDLYGPNDRVTEISLDPVIDYFAAPNLFIGPALSYAHRGVGDYSANDFGIGAEVGYTFAAKGAGMIPFLKAGFAFLSTKSKQAGMDSDDTVESKSTGTTIVLGGGLVFQAAKHAGITVDVGYHMDSMKADGASKSLSGNVISVGVGVIGLIF